MNSFEPKISSSANIEQAKRIRRFYKNVTKSFIDTSLETKNKKFVTDS